MQGQEPLALTQGMGEDQEEEGAEEAIVKPELKKRKDKAHPVERKKKQRGIPS